MLCGDHVCVSVLRCDNHRQWQCGAPQDIVIQGFGVEERHCYISHTDHQVTLHPLAVLCAIDGVHVNKPTKLLQGKKHTTGKGP